MDIRIQQGDITTAECGYIVHGVNCQGAMGAGVAKSISDKWPVVKEVYLDLCCGYNQSPEELLGTYQTVHVADKVVVVNAFTQLYYGNDPLRRYASPMAIEWSIRHVCQMIDKTVMPEYKRVHLPQIGGLRGGLNFDRDVMPIIERLSRWYPSITFVIWEYKE